jgi:alpha-methylacyl-CoA racemase
MTRHAPLNGVRVVELAGMGPGPHVAMMLADLGADVVRVEQPAGTPPVRLATPDPTLRRKRRVELDLKGRGGVNEFLALAARADVLVEGFRPGVVERLGVGPQQCRARNARLVYARVTGWGQDGPLATAAGHDINFLSITGALHAIGGTERPLPPLNLVGDFGGGSMLALVGVLAALLERERSGEGQVVDAAMIDGTGLLMQMIWWLFSGGTWRDARAMNSLDGGAPFYRTYRCADGHYVAVGCIEPRFYDLLIRGLALDPASLPDQNDRERWPELAAVIGARFAARTRDHWVDAVFAGTDACVTPVLSLTEAPDHPHIVERGSLHRVAGGIQAGRAPRLSETPLPEPDESDLSGCTVEHAADIVAQWERRGTPDWGKGRTANSMEDMP